VNLKRKYEEGSDYMDGIATTVNQNRLIEMRGPTGTKNPGKHRLSSPLAKKKDATLVFISSVGLLMVHSFFPKVDQEESIHIIHKI
jgi:hypothetical protein